MLIYLTKPNFQIRTPYKFRIGTQKQRGTSSVQSIPRNKHHAERQIKQVCYINSVRWSLPSNQVSCHGNLEKYFYLQNVCGIGRIVNQRWIVGKPPAFYYLAMQLLRYIQENESQFKKLKWFLF